MRTSFRLLQDPQFFRFVLSSLSLSFINGFRTLATVSPNPVDGVITGLVLGNISDPLLTLAFSILIIISLCF